MSSPAGAPGPVVAVCTGHRCSGLRRLGGGQDLDEGLRAAVRASAGGVLLSCPCVGRCAQGPVTVVGHHAGAARGHGGERVREEGREGQGCSDARDAPTSLVWLTESSDPGWHQVLEAWVSGGASVLAEPRADGACVIRIPGALRSAVIGASTGAPLRRLEDPPDQRSG